MWRSTPLQPGLSQESGHEKPDPRLKRVARSERYSLIGKGAQSFIDNEKRILFKRDEGKFSILGPGWKQGKKTSSLTREGLF
jgi:DNA/RNA-binding domain of Phe-tRNA-synthetase-like protein